MRRLWFIAALFAACAVPIAAQGPPNIIFIQADDMRADSMGCAGNPIVQTPNLDRLAAKGALFTNNFCTTSICAVSRATMFTGQYASRHGIQDFSKPLSMPQMARTYFAILRKIGYRTGFVGKWGLGGPLPGDEFDYFAGYAGQGRYFETDDKSGTHLTRKLGDQALEFLRTKDNRPFCLSISFKAPHVQDGSDQPFQYDPKYESLYQDVTIPTPRTATEAHFKALPEFIQNSEGRNRWHQRFATPEQFQESVKSYYRLITGMDAVIGDIMDELERQKIAERTAIVFTSDNGFFLGEKGLAGKWLMYEESIRTPLIIYYPYAPKERQGVQIDQITLSNDIAPTLISFASVPTLDTMQGRSVLPLLLGQKLYWRHEFFYEHHFDYGGKIPSSEGVRIDNYKYIRYIGTDPAYEELYDLKNDPYEVYNIAGDQSGDVQAILKRLRDRWAALHEQAR